MSSNVLSYPQSRYEDSHLAGLTFGGTEARKEFSLAEDFGGESDFAGIVG